jgi:hypothetical protein
MITYSTNWMGPVNMDWFRKRGLTHRVIKECTTEEVRDILRRSKYPTIEIGDTFETEEIHTYYACGRIDIRDDTKEGYAGWDEYGVAPMHGEDWNALSDFLWDLTTEELLSYNELIHKFEEHYGKKIRWAD